MFYSHEILRKKGKFGIVWLAATCRQRITRRDIWRVNVADSSDDIMEILNRTPVALRRTGPLSLYLSSQLMFGLVYVTSKQYQMLLGTDFLY
ncbi:UNVERIFIED_CONTAM: Sister chromatid cohesion 1 protein 3 [Trichonephila clavipes]